MTWLRLDTDAARSGVAGDLAKDLGLPPMHAFGHYVATISGFGEHQQDGVVAVVADDTLEGWALWKGKAGRFAKAFRARCTADGQGRDPAGVVRGWWRQEALLRKQIKDNSRLPSHLRNREFPQDSPEIPAGESSGFPRNSPGGDVDVVTVTERDTDYNGLRGRLMKSLVGHAMRYTIVGFLDSLPPGENVDAWAGVLGGCLGGLGTAQGRQATVEDLAAACLHFGTVPPRGWKPAHFVSWVDRIIEKRRRPPSSSAPSSRQTREIEAAAAFVAKGEPE